MSADRDASGRPQLESLVRRARGELRDWTSATYRDPGLALVELWALVGDLLSSYAERVADEAQLGGARGSRTTGVRTRGALGIAVEVDGEPWLQVPDLGASAPDEPHYLVRHREDGASVVEFGDGVHGRRPSSDSSIGVRYGAGRRYSSVLLQRGRVIVDTDWGEAPPGGTCGVFRATVLDNVDPLAQRRLLVQVPDLHGDQAAWAVACLPAGGPDEIPAAGDGVWVAVESCDPSRLVWLGRLIVN